MRIKNTAFIYNVTVGGSSNCDWGTELGQSSKHTFTLEGFPEIANAMLYYKIDDIDNLEVILGKGNRTPQKITSYKDIQLVLAACFKKVYLNDRELVGQRFIMYIIKELKETTSKGDLNKHKGRCTLKFSNSVRYRGLEVNKQCIDAISKAFDQSEHGSWAILKMEIHNEDELHFYGFALGNTPKEYSNVHERNTDFERLMNSTSDVFVNNEIPPTSDSIELDTRDYAYMAAIKTKPFLIIGGFSGTGKSLMVKSLAFGCCPCDGELNTSETSPGNYLLVSVKPNWHDATDITGFRSSVNRNYYVTDFMRFLVKAKLHPEVPFFVCLDEMNLAPVEEYFADFLSVIESRKRKEDGTIVTDAIVPASVFDDKDYADDFNIFLKLGLKPVNEVTDVTNFTAQIKEDGNDEAEYFQESWLVDELRRDGLTIPQNVIIIGTVNMDDTTNSFSRKVIDRAMTFETIVSEFDTSYFDADVALCYFKHPRKGELFISDEVRATDMIDNHRFELSDEDKQRVIGFINDINADLEGTPFKISYRILNETILLYRAKQEIAKLMDKEGGFEDNVTFNTDLNAVFDDILMQKVLPRIEGDYEKCDKCLVLLAARAEANNWMQSAEKIEFMIKRFGKDKSGFTTFWN